MEYLLATVGERGELIKCTDGFESGTGEPWNHLNDIAKAGWVYKDTVQLSTENEYAILLMERPTQPDTLAPEDESEAIADRLDYANDVLRKQGGEF